MLMHNLLANQYALPARHPCCPHRVSPGALLECFTPRLLIGQQTSPSVGAPTRTPPAANGLARINYFPILLCDTDSVFSLFVSRSFSSFSSSSLLFFLLSLSLSLFPTVGLRFFSLFHQLINSIIIDTLRPVIRPSLDIPAVQLHYYNTPGRVTPLIQLSRRYFTPPVAFRLW